MQPDKCMVVPQLSGSASITHDRVSCAWQVLSQASGLMQAPFKLDAAGGGVHQGACGRVLAFAHVMLCLVLPTALLFQADAQSRAAFRAAARRPAAPRPDAGLQVLDGPFLLPLLVSLVALLAWEALQLLPL